jgi:DNA end-binding protein Ku
MEPGAEVKPQELELAKQIIGQIATEEFQPKKYEDDVKKRIQEQIQRKVEGQQIEVSEAPAPQTQVIDLMEALKASLAARSGKVAPAEPAASEATEQPDEGRKPAKRVQRAEKAAPKASRK